MSELKTDVLITHPENGVFLGACLGMGFWSKLDSIDQPSAVTFESQAQAEDFLSTCVGDSFEGVQFVPVVPDMGHFASVQACVAAGQEAWDFQPGFHVEINQRSES